MRRFTLLGFILAYAVHGFGPMAWAECVHSQVVVDNRDVDAIGNDRTLSSIEKSQRIQLAMSWNREQVLARLQSQADSEYAQCLRSANLDAENRKTLQAAEGNQVARQQFSQAQVEADRKAKLDAFNAQV